MEKKNTMRMALRLANSSVTALLCAGAAGVVLAVEAVDGRLFSFAIHAPGANLALVLLPVLLVPATHAGQNQSRRPTWQAQGHS